MDFSNDVVGVNLRAVHLGDLPRVTAFPFQVNSFGYIKDNWHNDERVYGAVTFGLMLSSPGGVLHRMINGREAWVRCPSFHINRPGSVWQNLSPNPWDEFYFVYKPPALAAFESLGFAIPLCHATVITPALVDMLRKLIKLVVNHQVAGNIDRFDALAFQIMMDCVIAMAAPPDENPVDEVVKEVLSLIRLNHRDVADLKGFLRKRGVGYRTFLRRWHAVMQQTPSHYALDLRMADAQQMLGNTGRSVKSIAGELGFDDPLYFSRMFRRQTGLSPTAFRKMQEAERAQPAKPPAGLVTHAAGR